MRKYTFLVCILIIGLSTGLFGQEVLINLQSIPVKKIELNKSDNQFKAQSKSGSPLPFFDDFSRGVSTTEPSNWINSYVQVNLTYPINPPSIGVATFDATDQFGRLYNLKDSIPADTLTSQPININLPEEANLYFSFQYQPKGLGEAPDPTDSLVVEFLSKDNNEWARAWSASANFSNNKVIEKNHFAKEIKTRKAASIDNAFFKVMLPVTDERFRKDGFQFRFLNYASTPPNTQVPSLRGNGDHWHIDLVYLDSARTLNDTILDDVTFSQPLKSFLKNYESLPWKHFTSQAKLAESTNPPTYKIQHRYLGSGPQNANFNRVFTVSDYSNPGRTVSADKDAVQIPPFQTIDYSRGYEYTFLSDWADSAKYLMECYLEVDETTLTPYLHWNDTVRYTQQFFNYYAYDDGSAEMGYGIYGEGTQGGKVALKYHSYVDDSLKGILIYFNRIIDFQYLDNTFDLMVWNDNNGKPGTVLYQKTEKKPTLTYDADSLYKIDTKLKLGGDFWVGTINGSDDMLNVGFDLNNNHNDKLYYNITGEWVQSNFKGSLMMKPVFGRFALGQTGIDKPTSQTEFSLYPNPTSNQVSINIQENTKPDRIRILNLAGQVVLTKPFDGNNIDVSNLPTGIYLFQLTLRNHNSTTKKLVIIK